MTLALGTYDVPKGHLATVMTKLEMTAPAITTAMPFPDGFTARKENLTAEAFRDLYRTVGAPWLWSGALLATDADLKTRVQEPDIDYWVIYQDDTPVGLIELDFRMKGACELVLFGMIKAVTGQGLGGPMMALAQHEAFARDITRFHLSTCNYDSPAAMPFYLKAGFIPFKMAVEVYPDPRVVGALPKDTAPHVACLP